MDLLNQRFDFSGVKIALFYDNQILTILRDDKPDIPYPNMWDLAGGGRENDETPFECVQREVSEELGLSDIHSMDVHWIKSYQGVTNSQQLSIFMVGQISQDQINQIIFGDEGQGYKLMPVEEFLSNTKVIPQLQTRLRDWYEEKYVPLEGLGSMDCYQLSVEFGDFTSAVNVLLQGEKHRLILEFPYSEYYRITNVALLTQERISHLKKEENAFYPLYRVESSKLVRDLIHRSAGLCWPLEIGHYVVIGKNVAFDIITASDYQLKVVRGK